MHAVLEVFLHAAAQLDVDLVLEIAAQRLEYFVTGNLDDDPVSS